MQIRLSRDLLKAMRKAENVDLRQMIRLLQENPRPGWAYRISQKEERYEFLASGQWVQYIIDESGMEMVIVAVIIDKPYW